MPRAKPPPTPEPHEESDQLLRAMRRCSAQLIRWHGDAYRVTSVARANEEDLVSGEGSRIYGGRWNPPGPFRTVYLALHYSTAMEEYLAQNRRNGLPDAQAMPSVTTAVSLELHRALDLTLPRVRAILKLSLHRMVAEPHGVGPVESLTQAVGRLAWSECFDGLLVPSAACSGAKNIVVFPGKLSAGQMKPINPSELPGTTRKS